MCLLQGTRLLTGSIVILNRGDTMKSRVERYKDLHKEIDNSVDERIENKDLSSYANRLNLIDDQFEKMDVETNASHTPTHARGKSEPEVFDTFENEYLRDFLDEVKAYNVEKGYRSVSDTQNNILSGLSTELKSEDSNDKVTEDSSIEEASIEEIFDSSSKQFWDDYVRRNIEKRDSKEEGINPSEEDNYDEVRSIADEVFALTQEIDLGETKVFDEYDFIEETAEVDAPNLNEETTGYVKEPQDFIEETLEYHQVQDDIEEAIPFEEDIEEVVIEPVIEEVVIEPIIEEPIIEETVSAFSTETSTNLSGKSIAENQNTEEFFSGYYSEMEEEFTPEKVRKSRLINAAINIALIGVVLGIALVVRFLLIK